MSYGSNRNQLSECAAEWLDVHRYFNAKQSSQDARNTTVQMFPPSLASPPHTIRLRFEVTDPDGLHQAQLFEDGLSIVGKTLKLIACKRLTGTTSTVEFVTTELTPADKSVYLQFIDLHGNISSKEYSIDITFLFPPSEVVSIPDANLAAEVREALGLAPGDTLMSHTMLKLGALDIQRHITDFTGLEYASNLTTQYLTLGGLTLDRVVSLTQYQTYLRWVG